MRAKNVTVQQVTYGLTSKDVNNNGQLRLQEFINMLQYFVAGTSYGPREMVTYQEISQDFDGGSRQDIYYRQFIEHLEYQNNKLTVLETFYLSVDESLKF